MGLLGATSNCIRCFGGLEKKVKEEFGTLSLEVDAFGYSAVHLDREELPDLFG